jgi:hypothetical protein
MFTTKIPSAPSTNRVNAIDRLSGDQSESRAVSWAPAPVMRRRPVPSGLTM